MLSCVAELFCHFPNGSVCPLRAFECDEANDIPTLGKCFQPDEDTLSWSFGRHPEYCDVVISSLFSSAIHFVIFYDRSLGDWFIQDGGYYPRSLQDRRSKRLYRTPGYDASTAGTYLNSRRLQHVEPTDTTPLMPRKMPLYSGDRVYAAGEKIAFTAQAMLPKDYDWSGQWVEVSPADDAEKVTPKQEEELKAQQQRKVGAASDRVTLATMLTDYLKHAPVWERLLIWLLVGVVAIAAISIILGAA